MRPKRVRVEAGVVGLGLVFVTSVGSCGPGETASSDGPLELDETSVHVVGSSDAIATVQDVDVLEDGSIWVLNSVEPFFVGLGSDGEIVEEYGARGGGPDEFDAPAGFVEGATGATAWVLDSRRNTLVEVPRPSSGRSEIPLHRDSVPPGSLQSGMGMMSSRVRSARVGEATLVARSYGSLRTGVWSFLPRYVDMRCSEDGALWLQPMDLSRSDLEGGRSWVRVAPDGAARTVLLPPRFDGYRFLRGRILGIQRDELDVASVAWVELPFS